MRRHRSNASRLAQILLPAVLPLAAIASGFQTPAITPADLAARQAAGDKLLVVDVRKNNEYKSGHVPGAVNIPHDRLEQRLDELRDADGVVLYCIFGKRTRQAEQTLIEQAVPNVMHLDGGLMGWRQGGFEVRTGWGP